MTTQPINPGFVSYDIRAPSAGGKTELANFGVGFGVRIVSGGQAIRRVHLVGRADFELSDLVSHDGQVIAAPNGFDRVFIEWAGDAIAKVHRVAVEVLTQPAAVWAVTDSGSARGARILWESSVHVDPNGSQPSVSASGELVVADVLPGEYYQQPDASPGGGVYDTYQTRAVGDERARWFPSAGLYFDGFLATAGTAPDTDLVLVVQAYTFSNAGTPALHWWAELSNWRQQVTTVATAPAIATDWCLRLNDLGPSAAVPIYTVPIPVPPDGFRLVLVNSSGANAYTIYGRVGARSA